MVTAAIFLHLPQQKNNTQGGSFAAFMDRAIWCTQSKVVLQPPCSLYSLRAITLVAVSGMPRCTSCGSKCKATVPVQWWIHTWKCPPLFYGLALYMPLNGGPTVHSIKFAISLTQNRFSPLIFVEVALSNNNWTLWLSNWQLQSEHYFDFLCNISISSAKSSYVKDLRIFMPMHRKMLNL